jgi:diacylglycerol O-acyltransferase / wax synthase
MASVAHMDRLTAIDASFLTGERGGSHMHIGAVMTFDGEAPNREQAESHIASRLHLVPRYRQKLRVPRLELGRPLWVDDPSFNINYHVRHTALPSPGSTEQLRRLTARIFSQRLDRTKPLWEIWLVEGLEQGGFALINKTHHSLVDGVSGVDVTAVLFDLEPEPPEPAAEEAGWLPRPEPSSGEVVAAAARDLVRSPLGIGARALGAVRQPRQALAGVREAAEGVAEFGWGLVDSPPSTPLNVSIGPHRRLLWVRTDLAELKRIKNGMGGTVNDVFLAVVSGALSRWLETRGVHTEGLELRGCVPVSVRAEDERRDLGNKITMMACPLPVYAKDPRTRFRIVSDAMKGLKESKQALGAEVIGGLQGFAPPTILAQASRLQFSSRLYNLLVTNVPGPQFPLYFLGSELRDLIPIPFLAPDKALAIAIMSYNGGVQLGLMGDYDAMEDLDLLGDLIAEEIATLSELVDSA